MAEQTQEEIVLDEKGDPTRRYEDLSLEELSELTKPGGELSPDEIEVRRLQQEHEGQINRIFSGLRKLQASGHVFTDAQMDIAATMLLSRLEAPQKQLIEEYAKQVFNRPLWQLFAGWYRQIQELGMASGCLFDPSWEQPRGADQKLTETACKWEKCQMPFTPKRPGQMYCSNKCGGEAEMAERKKQRPTPSAQEVWDRVE